jgi:hypothetical protein
VYHVKLKRKHKAEKRVSDYNLVNAATASNRARGGVLHEYEIRFQTVNNGLFGLFGQYYTGNGTWYVPTGMEEEAVKQEIFEVECLRNALELSEVRVTYFKKSPRKIRA